MNQGLVSTIMPTFNHGAFIGDAIRSVLNQTYKNFELIIIDNHSTDGTEQIVKSFKDEKIGYYKFSNRGIIAASRNFGIQKAEGEFIAFLDSDDEWYKDKLKLQIDLLTEKPDVALCFCPFTIVSSDKEYDSKICSVQDKHLSEHAYEKMINCNFIVCSSVVIRTTTLQEVGNFDESPALVGVEDFDLWLRISRKSKVFHTPNVQGAYRWHSTSYGRSVKSIERSLNVIHKHLSLGWISSQKASRAKANFCFREGWVFINKDATLARSYFIKALEVCAGNFKIIFACSIGMFFSLFPALHRIIRDRHWDRQIAQRYLNVQNL